LELTQNLSLDFGARLDWYETYGALALNPEGSLKYLLGKGQDLYFEVGTGYRYPDFNELYHPTITYLITPQTPVEFGNGESGNPDLKPETSINLEAGTDLLVGNALLKLSGFLNSFSNLIVPAENGSNFWTFLNVPHALQVGGEIGLHWELLKEVSLNGDYTYVDSRDTDSGQLIPTRLRQKLSGGFTWTPAPGAQLSLDGRYVDRNPALYNGPQGSPPIIIASAYTVFDAGFKLEVAKGTSFFLTLDNLFNQTYATVQGLPMPGRYMELGTRIGF
jgi:outer membrane receptor protein involved in Fe transport